MNIRNFLKGIAAGVGGVAPGLSGSVLLIIFGLYEQILHTLGSLFRNFKKNVSFLFPIVCGMGVGVILFSRVIDYFLEQYEMPTRFCFFGLIIGTIPLFYKQVKKNGFSNKYYLIMTISVIMGLYAFRLNPDSFPQVSNPDFLQSLILGGAVAVTAIVPGIDPAVFLSSLGYYEVYVKALANIDLKVLVPVAIGLVVGAVAISLMMSVLFDRFYTFTYSVIFGLFLSMIPNMLSSRCILAVNAESFVSLMVGVMGFFVSFYLGRITDSEKV